MAETRPTYTAVFERAEDGSWVVGLLEEPNVHGYGATLAEARGNIREAIVTLFGPFETGSGDFELVEDVRVPAPVAALVERARSERHDAQGRRAIARATEETMTATAHQLRELTLEAARLLVEHGEFMRVEAESAVVDADVRIPEAVLLMVESAHQKRQAADEQAEAVTAARAAADAISAEALATNRAAARALVERCGLTTAETASLLELSVERAQRLLGP